MNSFDMHTQLGDLKLHAQASYAASIIAISGDNGVGKSTLLRCLAGLQACEGRIQCGAEVWLDSSADFILPTAARNIGFVWAESVLLPWLHVEDNIKLGVSQEDKAWCLEVCAAFEVTHLCNRQPAMLSTGEAQRIALARAFYRQPDVLLLDEPFSAQAPDIRQRLRHALQRLQQTMQVPVLLVSHDADDQVMASDHWYMREGKLMASIHRHAREDGNLKEQKVNHE